MKRLLNLLVAGVIVASSVAGVMPQKSAKAADYLTTILTDPDLISFWRMEELSGTTFTDNKSGFTANISGNVTLGTSISYLSSGNSTGASFNGTTGYANIGDRPQLDFSATSPFTLSAIVTPSANRSSSGIINYWIYTKAKDSADLHGLDFGLRWTGTGGRTALYVQFIANYPTDAIDLVSTADLQNGTPYMVTLTYDGSRTAAGMKMYVDGALTFADTDMGGTSAVSESLSVGANTTAIGYPAQIGKWGGIGQFFNGSVKDLAIYSTNKSGSWIYALSRMAASPSSIDYTVASPRPQVFYDLDLDSDSDDIVDAELMLALERRGELDLIGSVVTSNNTKAAPAWFSILSYYGRNSLPVGVNTNSVGDYNSLYDAGVTTAYGISGKTDASQFESYLVTQRRALASSADNSVEYITTGDLSSVKGLLESPADVYSSLNGTALVAQKVRHLWVVAGNWPAGMAVSDFGSNPTKATISNFVLTTWPTTVPIIFDSISDGTPIHTGNNTMTALNDNDPARYGWQLYYGNNSSSNKNSAWSQLAIISIARGVFPNSTTSIDYEALLGRSGTATVNATTGNTTWNTPVQSNHAYLVKSTENSTYSQAFNNIIRQTPLPITLTSSNVSVDKDGLVAFTVSGNHTYAGNTTVNTGRFNLGLTSSYGTNTTAVDYNTLGSKSVSSTISNPSLSTVYFRFSESNTYTTAYGQGGNFSITSLPSVTTGAVTAAGTTATLNGNISSMGVASSAYRYFEWYQESGPVQTTAQGTSVATGAYSDTITFDTLKSLTFRAVTKVGSVYSYGAWTTLSHSNAVSGNLFLTILPFVVGAALVVVMLVMYSGKIEPAYWIASLASGLVAYVITVLLVNAFFG